MATEKRLIDANDAQEVKKALAMCYKQGLTSECEGCAYRANKNICMDALMEDALALINSLESCIDALTTVDAVEVVHGRWRFLKNWDFFVCSECSYESSNYSHYCPNCGAKMDGDGNA